MLNVKSKVLRIAAFVSGIWCLATGLVDMDWQLVAYRYFEWHRSIDYWEYNPFIKINWWIAYQLNLLRIIVGVIIISVMIDRMVMREK